MNEISVLRPELGSVASKIIAAKKRGAVVLMMGAHVLRSGVQRWADENVTNRVANCDPVFVPPIFFNLKISLL